MRHILNTTSHRVGISLAVFVLALFGLVVPAAAADQVPFSASGTAVITGMTRLPGGLIQYNSSLSGNATYLGAFTGTATRILDRRGEVSATGCLVGANGTDSVCYARSGHAESTQDPCVFTSTTPYTVTGGTGKFANATGGGTITGRTNYCTGTISFTATGTIPQPNSG